MKKSIILILFIWQAFLSFGQELKTKKMKVDEAEGVATFYVLASNDTIKHGTYQIKAYTGNRILLSGTYANNKKVGFWTEQYYGESYAGPKAAGNYDNDIKIGNWTYFNYQGDTVMIYDWTDFKVILNKYCQTNPLNNCPPTCATGRDYFLYEISGYIEEQLMNFEIPEFRTKISITVDKNGAVSDISFSTNEKPQLVIGIEEFIKSFRWIPGRENSEEATSKFEFSIDISNQF
jgi:hypothetical protein